MKLGGIETIQKIGSEILWVYVGHAVRTLINSAFQLLNLMICAKAMETLLDLLIFSNAEAGSMSCNRNAWQQHGASCLSQLCQEGGQQQCTWT